MAVIFDAVGAGGSNVVTAATGTNSKTWSHTVAADANYLLVGLTCWDITYTDPSISTHSRTVTYNGVAMTSLGATGYPAYGFIEWFYLASPATGANTVSVSVTRTSGAGSQPWAIMCDSLSYKNVASVTAGTAQSAASGAPSASVSSAVGRRCPAMLSASVNNPGSYNQTSRSAITSAAHYAGVTSHSVIGDASGSGTVTHSEGVSGNVILAQALDLVESGGATPTNQFFAMF